jgi:hypothetical protein
MSQEDFVPTRIIHLINPKTDSATTRPLYMNRALYSPLAGLLAVAASTPRDQYEVVLTDENIETIDFDLKADLVGISAMTSYVNRGYEIADQFRAKGVPVVMGGVHPSFMSQEALKHCDAVVIGEVELVIDKLEPPGSCEHVVPRGFQACQRQMRDRNKPRRHNDAPRGRLGAPEARIRVATDPCRLCGRARSFRLSHILPKFVIRFQREYFRGRDQIAPKSKSLCSGSSQAAIFVR